MSIEFLFIRLLEACNAGCFMCSFANSRDPYRLSVAEFDQILSVAQADGVKYVRFTGGEPLLHRDMLTFVQMIHDRGIQSSIITNGALLPKKAAALAAHGLNQIIVSIDSPIPEENDKLRGLQRGYELCIQGLLEARAHGIRLRVNTVCGPHNFRDMPRLQRILTDLGVEQWEMSTLKLERPLDYTAQDIEEIPAVVQQLYVEAPGQGLLVPLGKIWCGNTPAEQERYFSDGIAPRPDDRCHVVNKVRYLDAKEKRLYGCSLIPHRPEAEKHALQFASYDSFRLHDETMEKQVSFFRTEGPNVCTGCSSTASGCSNLINTHEPLGEWFY
ncbi:MAG: radical SAM protein [Ardenticatenales bacterium]|nr:radical SAM protein [Ardenticatenales bacterium]